MTIGIYWCEVSAALVEKARHPSDAADLPGIARYPIKTTSQMDTEVIRDVGTVNSKTTHDIAAERELETPNHWYSKDTMPDPNSVDQLMGPPKIFVIDTYSGKSEDVLRRLQFVAYFRLCGANCHSEEDE